MFRSHFVQFFVLPIFFATVLYGQAETATLTGVITDSAEAVVPDVSVAVRNTDTNIRHSRVTNAVGYFTITNLPPGPYELTASKLGFQTHKQTSIVLQVGQVLRNDLKLQVGAVTETVNVQAEVAPLNTENGAIKGDVIVQSEIRDMPLNGRDVTELALLVPGVVPSPGGGSFASINGARSDNTNFYVDGISNLNTRGFGSVLTPNLDAMQEFKMEVSGYSAEFGKMAGGVLNMVLKSGTNRLHGSVFEYFRNNIFDSRAYFDKQKLGYHQNQWGGTVSGPVVIPKLYDGHDRTFFMFSEESYRLRWGETRLGNVPTALERAGDFTQTRNTAGAVLTVRNPYAANAPFPGNLIPASMFSPIALKLMQYYPLPNRTAIGNNFFTTATNTPSWDSPLGKIDHRLANEDSLSVNFGKRFNRQNDPWLGSNLGVFRNEYRTDNESGGLTYTHLFTPRFLTEFRFGLSRQAGNQHQVSDGRDIAAEWGIEGSTHDPKLRGLPLTNITNYLSLGFFSNQPAEFFVTTWQWRDSFTWIKAGHVIKFGFDYARYQINQPFFNNVRGTVAANGIWTGGGTANNGNAIGDLLLGLLNNSSILTQVNRNYMRQEGYGWYVNDDWKITRRLTLNLGLRYGIETPAYDKHDAMSNFIPSLNKIVVASKKSVANYDKLVADAGLTGRMVLAKDLGLPRGLVNTFYKGISPRVGFAWRPTRSDRTVLRGGYGIFYSGHALNDIRIALDNTFPFVLRSNFSRVAADPSALTLANPFNPARGAQTGTTTSSGYQYDAPMGYLQSYNLTVERDIGHGNVVEAAFAGSKGTHLGRQYDINFPSRTQEFFVASGTNFQVPYPPLGTINYWGFGSNSIYSAGQISLRRRSMSGLFYRLNYSYSKSLDTASQLTNAPTANFSGALDPRNLRLDRGRSDFDRGHIVTAVFSWPLPVGRGKRFLTGAHGIANGIFGGWQLAGRTTLYSGRPLTIQDSSVNATIGESTRPNRIASGKDVQGTGRRGVDYPWYDPQSFVHTAGCVQTPTRSCSPDKYGFQPFAPGNSGRNIIDTPGTIDTSLSMVKRFPVGEQKWLQLRWEVFNIFNHPNFIINAASVRNYNETSAGYLVDVAASGQGGPRIMQFALRFEF